MFDSSIDFASLCVVVVVVVCSWGLSLLLSLTCWNSYKKSQPNHLYCTQCSALQHAHMPPIPPLYQYPSYALPPSQYSHYQAHPHTAERLGIMDSGDQPAMLAPVLQSSHGSYSASAYTRGGGGPGLEVLETVYIPSPAREEDLDQNTIISRSFRSAVKRPSSSIDKRTLSRGATLRTDEKVLALTLNERFGTLSNSALFPGDANISTRSTTSAQSKLSQVRILTSPPPSDQDELQSVLTRTPSNAMRSTRKSLLSNISKRSVRSLLGGKRRSSSHLKTSKNIGGARSKVIITAASKDIEHGALTSDTNLETSDEEVFISQIPRTALQLGQHHATPVPEFPRQFSQEILLVHRLHLATQSQGSGGGSDWSNPRKDRQVGSPGNTANADYFIKKQTPQLLAIDLDRPAGEQPRTDLVQRVSKQGRRRATASAPARQSQARQYGGVQLSQASNRPEALTHNNLLSVKSHKAYKPGYSESDITSQSEDETRRNNWDRRCALELPAGGPSPGSGLDLTPPVLDLSQVVLGSASAPPSSDPLFATSALSTNPSPLQYSSVSFSQSDMSLVVSPARPPTPVSLPQYASSQSSHPMSLDWDNYASDPQFKQNFTEEMN